MGVMRAEGITIVCYHGEKLRSRIIKVSLILTACRGRAYRTRIDIPTVRDHRSRARQPFELCMPQPAGQSLSNPYRLTDPTAK